MLLYQTSVVQKTFSLPCAVNCNPDLNTFPIFCLRNPISIPASYSHSHSRFICSPVLIHCHKLRRLPCFAISEKADPNPDSLPNTDSQSKPKTTRRRHQKSDVSKIKDEEPGRTFPTILPPRKPRRGRPSKAAAVEDYIRDRLEQTFTSIKQQNPEFFEAKENKIDGSVGHKIESDDSDDDESDESDDDDDDDGGGGKQKTVVEEESESWPVDADVGWGTRASEYFEKYPIKNIVGEDGVEIDWIKETDDDFVKEINCLEWEKVAFHPSPLIVLVFERYNRATDNWKALKELEKAARVYWTSKDKLPPRTVRLDINIERDLAYALKVRECPQILFLRGNKIVYREKEIRKADELVQMIAHFYYKAKKPSWIDDAYLYPPY